eukprot:6067251-Prymnesium_polylepis.1
MSHVCVWMIGRVGVGPACPHGILERTRAAPSVAQVLRVPDAQLRMRTRYRPAGAHCVYVCVCAATRCTPGLSGTHMPNKKSYTFANRAP